MPGTIEFTFKRGLNNEAQKRATEFFQSALGKELVTVAGLQFFIRENYIDFYWSGCRVLSFRPLGTKNVFIVNRAYMQSETLQHERKDIALQHSGGDLWFGNVSFRERLIRNVQATLGRWTKGTGEGRLGEKSCLYGYCTAPMNNLVLDVEVAFSSTQNGGRPSADRLDLAVVNENSNRLEFMEAKRDSNSELRSKNSCPKVICQLEKYRDFLKSKTIAIEQSYKSVIANIINLGLADWFVPDVVSKSKLQFLIKLKDELTVIANPRLLVFQTKPWNDNDEKHWCRLVEILDERGFPTPIRQVVTNSAGACS